MEPITLATSVVGMLMPYLIKGGEAVAKKAIDESFQLASQLYQKVKEKFSNDSYAKETLKRVKENPDSEARKAALTGVLEEKIKDEPTFGAELEKLLALTKDLGGDSIDQTVNVSGKAKTGNITTIGKVSGNVDMSQRKKATS